jgi:hypothetical protein
VQEYFLRGAELCEGVKPQTREEGKQPRMNGMDAENGKTDD